MPSASAAPTFQPTPDGPAAWRASVIPVEPQKREPFDLRLSITPVWQVKSGLINGSAVTTGGAPAQPAPADLEEVDVAAFAYAAAILEDEGDAEPLRIPVSFVTLATQRARERLLRLTASVRETMRAAAVIEIGHLHEVPPSRLVEVAGLMRGLCGAVIAQVRPTRAAIDAVRNCGLAGVSVDAAWLGLSGPDAAQRLSAFAAATRDIGAQRMVHGLPHSAFVDLAAAAGFSHATVQSAAEKR